MPPDAAPPPSRRNLQSFLTTLSTKGGARFARAGAVRRIERTSGEVLARAGAASESLRREGVGAGDRVLLMMEDGPDWIAGFAACLAVGAVVVPLDRASPAAFVGAVSRRCGARALLCDALPAGLFEGATIAFDELGDGDPSLLRPVADPDPDDLAQIVFTSGTTADPRGVRITHRNIISALAGIEVGILRRERILRPFSPLTLISLVPLGHLFGQALGLFIPVILGARVVYSPSRPARALLDLARREKAWVMIVVPRHLSALREHLSRMLREPRAPMSRRWWIRALRSLPAVREHGWRLRAFVVGGARLDPDLEGWFKSLGYLVIQGYGLTETAPIVSVSNPFDERTGLLGRPGRAMEVRIGEDGEILVRGANVTAGYYGDEAATRAVLDGGWLRTGDLGSLEPDGTLRFTGRKKEMIVTSEGQNVFPDEVEGVLRAEEGIADCAVFASPAARGEQVAVAVIPDSSGDAGRSAVERGVAAANERLAPHQRVREWKMWPHPDFPRTPTGKVLRRLVAEQVRGAAAGPATRDGTSEGGGTVGAIGGADPLTLLRALARGDARADQRLGADLGLSSIDVAELAAAIEERYQVEVSPARIHEDVTLEDLVRGAREGSDDPAPWPMPRWAQSAPARMARSLLQALIVFPGLRIFANLRVEGAAHVGSARGPVLLAANHGSHLDVPLLLAALPRRARRRVAVAMQPEYFEPWLRGTAKLATRIHLGWQYRMVSLLLHTFPFPRSAAFKVALEYAGGLVDDGWTILVFPEGVLSPDGEVHAFRSGVGVLARELRLEVIPARIRGAWQLLPHDRILPRRLRHPVSVTWGAPVVRGRGEDPASFSARVEKAVRAL